MSAMPKEKAVAAPVSFDFQIKGSALLHVDGDTVRIALHLENPARTVLPESIVSEGGLDASLFRDNQQIMDWFSVVMSSFRVRAWDFLAHEAIRFQNDIANLYLDTHKIEEIDMRDIVKKHAKETEKGLHDALRLQGLGNFSAWTRLDLLRVVRAAFSKLPTNERNYDAVAAWMKTYYPDTAPSSGESLRQLVRHHKIDWKDLKAERRNPLAEEM